MGRWNTPDDLWRRVDKSGGPKSCWPFSGTKNGYGHGRLEYAGRAIVASRLAWELTYGPIPEGLRVLHSCDNPPCCNPGHLMLGTTLANSVDAARKGRLGVGKHATHCKRGHAFEGNTYRHPVTGRRECHECIKLRDKGRPLRARRGAHLAVAEPDGRCAVCGETLTFGSMGRGRIGWRHSRWAA